MVRLIDVTRRLAVPALGLVLLGACGPNHGTHRPPPAATVSLASPTPGAIPPNVRDASLLSMDAGWVLTDNSLLWTSDGGERWRLIAPHDLAPGAIHSAYFYDLRNGWLVASDTAHSGAVLAYSTHDGGATWDAVPLASAPANQEPYGRAEFFFIDRHRGWIDLDHGSHAGFSYGQLFKTTDGGATWSFVSNGQFGPMHFNSPRNGWMASYPLLVTHDGGATWNKTTLPPPFDAARPAQVLTTAHSTGLVAVNSRARVTSFAPDRGMRSWRVVGALSRSRLQTAGSVVLDLLDASTWAVYVSDSDRGASIAWTHDAGRTWAHVMPAGLPSTITRLRFVTPQDGWGLVVVSGCRTGKSDCFYGTELFTTSDGGTSWRLLRLA